MRAFLAAAAVTAAAVVTVTPPVAAAAPGHAGCAAAPSDPWCFFPAPAGWELATGDFWSCPSCQSHGREGVAQGRWTGYHCEGRVQGLGYHYDLYVPPGV